MTTMDWTGEEPRGTRVVMTVTDGSKEGVGVLFYRKWSEEKETFPEEFIDYLAQLSDDGHLDFNRMFRSDISDMEEVCRFRKVSSFSQALNNALFDIDVLPPFYYMGLPVLSGDYAQQICDMIEETYGVKSLFFSFPLM
ncbi:MAG: hypothetical protein QCI82_02440 [Candidatus Thermoplasmatota archaeon]|nr:hypothetical protein [Candidatus Thermoplasmatota archaeon]